MPVDLGSHYATVQRAITQGRLVPFIGAGVSHSARPAKTPWDHTKSAFLPDGNELAEYLKDIYSYPDADSRDLARVSQYVSLKAGDGALYEDLRALFDRNYQITPLHRFLAGLPALMRARGYPNRSQLVVTTNYDDLMERAFADAEEPYDVVTYLADGPDKGKFLHRPAGGAPQVILRANEYTGIPLDEERRLERSVVLKLHGAVDRTAANWDSFVITEDHYIEYLGGGDISAFVPQALHDKLKRSHFLFLGYGLRDWNLRVILRRIWGEQKLRFASWAIQLQPDELDQKFWLKRGVEIIDADLQEYLAGMKARVEQ